jgi:hypothetical protein
MPIHGHHRVGVRSHSDLVSKLKVGEALRSVKEKIKEICSKVLIGFGDVFHVVYRKSHLTSRSAGTQLVNFAFKKRMAATEEELKVEKQLHKTFDSDFTTSSIRDKKLYAEHFQEDCQEEIDDPEGIERIVQHRTIMEDIRTHHSSRKPHSLRSRVVDLTNPESDQVVHLPDGSATFSIPGGWRGHYVTYEVKMAPDDHGNSHYFFIMHNRGEGVHHPIHGPLTFKDNNGVIYKKTSVSIEVPKGALSEAFFKELTASHLFSGKKACYDCIQKHLLDFGGVIQQSEDDIKAIELLAKRSSLEMLGKLRNQIVQAYNDMDSGIKEKPLKQMQEALRQIAKSPEFNEYQELRQQADSFKKAIAKDRYLPSVCKKFVESTLDPLKAKETENVKQELRILFDRLIDSDDSFNSVQVYNTCTESNRTGPEKQMASPKARRQLKLYTIQQMTEGVKNKRALLSSYKERLIKLSDQRQEALKRKIRSL